MFCDTVSLRMTPFLGEARSMPSNTALQNLATHSLKHQEILRLFNNTGFDLFRETEDGEAVLDIVQTGNPASPINNYVRNGGEWSSFIPKK